MDNSKKLEKSLEALGLMLDKYNFSDEDYDICNQLLISVMTTTTEIANEEYKKLKVENDTSEIVIPLSCISCGKSIWMDTYLKNDGLCTRCVVKVKDRALLLNNRLDINIDKIVLDIINNNIDTDYKVYYNIIKEDINVEKEQ